MSDGLSIRPQTLHLSPSYRRLRDTLLRPHLRLTESRYFWERWKARLGPDATVLIMEVRDRCNRALATPPASFGDVSDPINTPTESAPGGEGCTVSAGELAAACGFSRVTLWRILQREDVRRFVSTELNYVYDRRLGKKRRTVSTYHVQMEDPLVEEDELRLQQLLEAHGALPGDDADGTDQRGASRTGTAATAGGRRPALVHDPVAPNGRPHALAAGPAALRSGARLAPANGQRRAPIAAPTSYPRPSVQTESEVVDRAWPTLHSETTSSGSIPKPQNVPETIVKKRLGEHALTSPLGVAPTGTAPEVDIWKRYPELAHYVEEAEALLEDAHSRGFYLKALKQLHPKYMDVWQRALGLAREQQNIRRSRGALFTRLLRTFAAEAGVTL